MLPYMHADTHTHKTQPLQAFLNCSQDQWLSEIEEEQPQTCQIAKQQK